MQLKVAKIDHLNENIRLIYFDRPKEFGYQAGQFLILQINNRNETKPRAYSIWSAPSENKYLILCIKLIPGGFASEILTQTKPGDYFIAQGPFGKMILQDTDEHIFISTGVGLCPFYSMLKEHLACEKEKKFLLISGYRYQKDILFQKEMQELKNKHNNFNYTIVLSKDSWSNQGHVQQFLPKDLKHKTFYLCGSKELIIETQELLIKNKVPKDKILFERYS